MSNEQPPVRDVVPYKSGKRISTFRKLNVSFGGTALEQALAEQEKSALDEQHQSQDAQPATTIHQSPPVTTSHHQSPETNGKSLNINALASPHTVQASTAKGSADPSHHQSPPVTTSHHSAFEDRVPVAPGKDFNKRANSIERDALPAGTFPGSTKKVYDALYLRTRGARIPSRIVQASRRDLLTWTGIRNLKTIDNHIRYLMATGLVVRHWELGSNEGAKYEVMLPEEAFGEPSLPLSTTGGESPPITTTQKLGIPTTRFLGSGGEGQTVEYKKDAPPLKTYKTNDDDDTHTLLQEFTQIIERTAREVCVGDLRFTDQEKNRWKELAELLSSELRYCAQRAESVSSVPAFFTAHLRKLFARKDRPEEILNRTGKTTRREKSSDAPSIREKHKAEGAKSKFTFEERQSYAQQQRPALGAGWLVESSTGKYDEVIRAWLDNARRRAPLASATTTAHADTIDASALDAPVAAAPQPPPEQCPDCRGTGMYYPEGYDKGAAKCRHDKLKQVSNTAQAAAQEQT